MGFYSALCFSSQVRKGLYSGFFAPPPSLTQTCAPEDHALTAALALCILHKCALRCLASSLGRGINCPKVHEHNFPEKGIKLVHSNSMFIFVFFFFKGYFFYWGQIHVS